MDISAIMLPPTITNTKSNSGSGNLSTTDFYKLLAAQIQYQNPFDDSGSSGGGSGSTGQVTDLAIMSATTAIQEMTKVENYSMSTAMAGKNVSYKSTTIMPTGKIETSTKNGSVTAVDFTADKPRFYVTSKDADGKTTGEWITYNSVVSVYSNDVTFDKATTGDKVTTGDKATTGV